MIVLKKIGAVLAVLVIGSVVFGYLPRPLAERLTRGILVLMIVGFTVRLLSYLMAAA